MASNQHKCGLDYLTDKSVNKSTAFTRKERDELGLRGLLPYAESNIEIQVDRILNNH